MIEIACLESNKDQQDDVLNGIKQLFEHCEIEVKTYLVKTSDEVVRDAQNGRLDVLVCDLSLNTADPLGLGVISDIKERCPGLFTIAITAGSWDVLEVEKQPRKYDLFIPKIAIFGREFSKSPDYVSRLFDRFKFSAVRTFIVNEEIKPIKDIEPPTRVEMLDLIRQTISYHPPFKQASLISDIELTQLGGGRSASYVFELKASMGLDHRNVLPVVLKFSRVIDWREEQCRYDIFVKWTLPHHMRVDVIGSGCGLNWGVTAYSFAHGKTGLITLTNLLNCKSHTRCESVIKKLFNGTHAFWVSTNKNIQYSSLAERYFERYYKKILNGLLMTIQNFGNF